jgi:hypothetical protein
MQRIRVRISTTYSLQESHRLLFLVAALPRYVSMVSLRSKPHDSSHSAFIHRQRHRLEFA